MGCSPRGRKELDTTGRLSMHIRVTRDDHSGTGKVQTRLGILCVVIRQLDLNLHTTDSL